MIPEIRRGGGYSRIEQSSHNGKEKIRNDNEIYREKWPVLVPAFWTNASMLSQDRVMLSDYPSAFAD